VLNWWSVPEVLAHDLLEQRTEIEAHLLDYWDRNVRSYPFEFLEAYLLPILKAGPSSVSFGVGTHLLAELLSHADPDVVEATMRAVIEPLAMCANAAEPVVASLPEPSRKLAERMVSGFRANP